jgi:hypothetical protein
MSPTRFFQFAIVGSLCLCGPAVAADPQPQLNEAQFVTRAQSRFNNGDVQGALSDYKQAYQLAPTSLNAVRIFVTSTYVFPVSSSASELSVWLIRKRAEARALGDKDASWDKVEDAITSLRFNIEAVERTIVSVRAQSASFERELNGRVAELSRTQSEVAQRAVELEQAKREINKLSLTVVDRDRQLTRCRPPLGSAQS